MPNYFADFVTTVHFIDQATLDREHAGLPHGGFVLRSGNTPAGQHLVEFRLELCSNPQFTAQVMLAYARAAARLHAEGVNGAQTVFDIAPRYLLPLSDSQQRATLL